MSTPEGFDNKGQEYNPATGLVRKFIQKVISLTQIDALWGQPGLEIIPRDKDTALTREYTAPTEAELDAAKESFGTYVNLNGVLPSVLLSVGAIYDKDRGDGSATDAGDASSSGTTAAISLQLSAKSSGSASAQPVVFLGIRTEEASRVPAKEYLFYMAGSPDVAAIIAKLNSLFLITASALPVFKPEMVNLFEKGRRISVTAAANVQQSLTASSGNTNLTYGTGTSESTEIGTNTRIERIEPTLHAAIAISSSSTTQAVQAAAAASFPSQLAGAWPARSASKTLTPTAIVASVTCSVASDTTIPATTPTDIPRTGLYVVDLQSQPEMDGVIAVRAVVVDMSYFAL